MTANTLRLIVEPDEGVAPVRELIDSAQTSLLIKQFTFTEPSLIQAVIDRRRAGVDVRVMLNAARSGGDRANDETYAQFEAADIAVQWASPNFYVTHEKSVVVDEEVALVATFNMCDKYFTRTRDYGVITDNPLHVAQIVEVFNADWDHADWTPTRYDGLLWSNSNSRLHMARFIDTAKHRLAIQHPKYVDAVILDHIAAAAGRGVNVHVLCGGRHGISDVDVLDTFASLRTLRRFGVKVRKQKNLQGARQAADRGRRARAGRFDEHRPQCVRPAPRTRHRDSPAGRRHEAEVRVRRGLEPFAPLRSAGPARPGLAHRNGLPARPRTHA